MRRPAVAPPKASPKAPPYGKASLAGYAIGFGALVAVVYFSDRALAGLEALAPGSARLVATYFVSLSLFGRLSKWILARATRYREEQERRYAEIWRRRYGDGSLN